MQIRTPLHLSLVALIGCTIAIVSPTHAKPLVSQTLMSGAGMRPFDIVLKGNKIVKKSNDFTPPWSGNSWDPNSTVEMFLKESAVHGMKAVGLKNLSGKPSIQMMTWQPIPLTGGKHYQVQCDYLTEGAGSGTLLVRGQGVAEKSARLTGTSGVWKRCTLAVDSSAANPKLNIQLQNNTPGVNNVLYIKQICAVAR